MADYNSSLPVRSEADADERLQSKIVDYTTPTQGTTVDTDGNLHIEVHGDKPAGTDVVLRLSELGAPNPDGDYDVTDNTKPASVGMIASDRGATIDETSQNQRVTAVAGASNSICLDIALHDESGAVYSNSNPLPVAFTENEGTEVVNYSTATVAAAGTSNHDYTVTAGKTLLIESIWADGSGKLKVEVQLETAAASGVFNTFFVGHNSTATPYIPMPTSKILKQVAGAKVRIIRTNKDNQSSDVYSTIIGVEI